MNKLQVFETNIIKWYPFKQKSTIMLVGENELIKSELEENCENVEYSKELQYTSSEKKYDYILLYDCINIESIIKKACELLEEDGKLLIVGNNKFSINRWSKYDEITKLEEEDNNKLTIKNLRNELNKNEMKYINVFYAFPDYKYAEIIINENMKIQNSYIEKYYPQINEDEVKLFDEKKMLKSIITSEPKMIDFFANSFFIEASKTKIDTNIQLVSYNNCRKEKYRLITEIKENVVEKIPATISATEHIENMKQTIENVKKNKIEILDYEQDGKIYSKLVKGLKTLDEILGENYNNLEYVVKILNELKAILLINAEEYEKCKDKINIKGNEEALQQLHFMPEAFWDMVPKNCFYIDEKYVFFDQEWQKEYLPVEFIIYRSVLNSYDLVRKINVEELLNMLGILEYKDYFEILDQELRKEIIDEEIYENIFSKEIKGIGNFINDNKIYKEVLNQVKEDNSTKQKYIEELEDDNRKKQEYIEALEKDRDNKQQYIEKLEEEQNKKKKLWKSR